MENDINTNNTVFISDVSHENYAAADIINCDGGPKRTQQERTPAQLKSEISKLKNLFKNTTPSSINADDAQNSKEEPEYYAVGDKNNFAGTFINKAYYRIGAKVDPQNKSASTNVFMKLNQTSFTIKTSLKKADENPNEPNQTIKQIQTTELNQNFSAGKDLVQVRISTTSSGIAPSDFNEKLSNDNNNINFCPTALTRNNTAPDTSTKSAEATYRSPGLRTILGYTYTDKSNGKQDSIVGLSSIFAQAHTPLINNAQKESAVVATIKAGQFDSLPYSKAELNFYHKKISYEPKKDEDGNTSVEKTEQSLYNLNACLLNAHQIHTRYDDNGNEISYTAPTGAFNLNGSLRVNPSIFISGSYDNFTNQEEPYSNASNLNFGFKKQFDKNSSIGLGYTESSSSLGNTKTYSAAYENTNNHTPFTIRGSTTIDSFNRSSYSASLNTPLGPKSSASFQYDSSDNFQTYRAGYRRNILQNLFLSAEGARTITSSGQQYDSLGVFLNGSVKW